MILVYIAGQFSAPNRDGVEANIARAVKLGIDVAEAGAFPVIPHANTAHPDFEVVQPYEFWIAGTLDLLRRSDALITVPGWNLSKGATSEHDYMVSAQKPVFYDISQLRGWLERQRIARVGT